MALEGWAHTQIRVGRLFGNSICVEKKAWGRWRNKKWYSLEHQVLCRGGGERKVM